MKRPLLILLEGANDLEFLVRNASRLHLSSSSVPNLHQLQADGRVALVPLGGGDPATTWPDRLRALELPEFHLYDREQVPETEVRRRAVARVNTRHGCCAALTGKRCLENYLHPQAIAAAGGIELAFGDDDPVSMLLARRRFEHAWPFGSWDGLTRRAQRRLAASAKRWLNRVAVGHMTAELLAERDPAGELLGWLRTMGNLALATG